MENGYQLCVEQKCESSRDDLHNTIEGGSETGFILTNNMKRHKVIKLCPMCCMI